MLFDWDVFNTVMMANVIGAALWKLHRFLIASELAQFEVKLDDKFATKGELESLREELHNE